MTASKQLNKAEPKIAAALNAAKRFLMVAGGLSFFVNLLMLTGPLYMLQIYDRVIGSRSYETLAVITILTFALFAGMAVLDFIRGALLARAGETFEKELQDTVFDLSMDAGRAGAKSPDMPIKDLRQIRQFVASPALTAVFDAPWAPFFLLLVFMMHWLLGVVATIGLIVLLGLAIANERLSRKATASALTMSSGADQIVFSSIRNAAAADAMGMRERLLKKWRDQSESASGDSLLASDSIGGLTAATKASRLFLQSAILGTGALLAIQGQVTPGVMIAASIIAGRALAPVETVTSHWRQFALTGVSFKRLRGFVGIAREKTPRTELPAPQGALSVEKLICRPGAAQKPVLKNVSFDLAPGEAVGVIGPSAAGKSTLVRALVGVEAALSGEVRLDGANIAHWDQTALGAFLGFLPQEVELFNGTIAQNIGRFHEQIDDGAVVAAAKAAGAHEMILGLPDGYETDIGDGGRHLSAGQRQRVGLARALYGDPKLIVLDEPNSNLDSDGEAALVRAMKGAKERGATIVIVAHRTTAIGSVDKLLLLVDGEVRAFGPRDEVLKKMAPRQVASFDAGARDKIKRASGND
ncbi:type I secretion system permease/ATPase [Marinicaulis aureus]|uniref:Type I secretion system permease/ATPase n=1 Tax=Hyphococcus aureus TaxID=2666033 RepID=A0ABW1KTE6_9PROT